MGRWKAPWRVLRDAAPTAVDDVGPMDGRVSLVEVDNDPPEAMGASEEFLTDLELDDGFSVRVRVLAGNATDLVERTQRLREQRDRERAAVPPIYNFGSEPSWSGGDW